MPSPVDAADHIHGSGCRRSCFKIRNKNTLVPRRRKSPEHMVSGWVRKMDSMGHWRLGIELGLTSEKQ